MSNNVGTVLLAPIIPNDTADEFPTHYAEYGKGGWRSVATTDERDAIPADRRESGMAVRVLADDITYILGDDLTTWSASTVAVDAADVTYTPANSIHWTDSEDPGDVNEALDDLASRVSGIEDQNAAERGSEFMSGYIGTPSNKDYLLVVKAAHGGTIEETTTRSESGTCTATFKINSTALGGTANSVSSSEQSREHATNNVFVAGDDVVLTVADNATCIGLSFTIAYTRT